MSKLTNIYNDAWVTILRKYGGFNTGLAAMKATPVGRALTLQDHLAQGLSHEQAWGAMEKQVMGRRPAFRTTMPAMPNAGMQQQMPQHAVAPTSPTVYSPGGGTMSPEMFPGMSPAQIRQIMAAHVG